MAKFHSIEPALLRRIGRCILAGLGATMAMSVFQNAWNVALDRSRGREESEDHEPTDIEGTTQLVSRAAEKFGASMSGENLRRLGLLGHYAFGIGMGVLYGLIQPAGSKLMRQSNAAIAGAAFGAAIFIVANEFVLPRFKVRNSQSPLGSRPYALASHLVYGLTLGSLCNLQKRTGER
jgi:uncharacterized membrane protein YdfJ with MMPL/SSD domain